MGSLILSLTVVPILATYFFRRTVRPWRNPVLPLLARSYETVLGVLVRRRLAAAALTVATLGLTYFGASRLGTEFLPALDEGVIWIRANLPPGISLQASAEVAARMRDILRQSPQVRMVTSQTGRQESNTEPFGPNRNELLVQLTPYSSWPPGMTKADLVRDLSERLRSQIPGVSLNFTQPIIDMVMESVTGSSADLAVILSGPDLAVLRDRAAQVLSIVNAIPGAADAAIEQEAGQPQVRIEVNRREAARYGINVADIQQVVELAIGGQPVSEKFEGDRKFDIVVRYVPEARSTLDSIGALLVSAPGGARIPLSHIADVRVADGESIIARRENQRMIAVRTNIRGRDQGSFAAEVHRAVAARVKLPPGYRTDYGGQFENLTRARRRLAWILPITVALIFVILYWAFNSVKKAVLVLMSVPLSAAGGVAALHLRGIPFSVSAAVGFISLFGVAVMSAVLFVTEIHHRRAHLEMPVEEAVLSGAASQFRALATLISVAMLGIVPAAIASGIGSDVQRPLATVVLGGLVSTLFVTLLAVPALYFLTEGRSRR